MQVGLVTINSLDLLGDISRDKSSWYDLSSYPSTLTLQRMIALADWAVDNPTAWSVVKFRHFFPQMTAKEIGRRFGLSERTVFRHLASPVSVEKYLIPMYIINEFEEAY